MEWTKYSRLNIVPILIYAGVVHAALLCCYFRSTIFDLVTYHKGCARFLQGAIADTTSIFYARQIAVNNSDILVVAGDSHAQDMNAAALQFPAINLGLGGDTSRQTLKRFSMYGNFHAKCFVLMTGTNDALQAIPPTETIHNIRLLKALVPRHIPMVIVSFIPAAREIRYSFAQNRLRDINEYFKSFVKCSSIKVLSIPTSLTDAEGFLLDVLCLADGLHLNSKKDKILIHAINSVLSHGMCDNTSLPQGDVR